ncbi:MAG: molybdopterin cofactor-binding domain-containing protein, partial [Sphingorhabdus sp.]
MMADNPNPNLEADAPAAPAKKKGFKRRAFLIGGAALVGGGIFAMVWGDRSAVGRAAGMLGGKDAKGGAFPGWLHIGADDSITVYSPHIDFGQGSWTGLAQMLADELDADWTKVKVEGAPPDAAFANTDLAAFFLPEVAGIGALAYMPRSFYSMVARNMPLQLTGGSSALRGTGQHGMRTLGAAVREALIAEAADRFKLKASDLSTENGKIIDKSSKSAVASFGQLAAGAAQRSLNDKPTLKKADQWKYIGKDVARLDIPAKVDGSAKYSIDVSLPEMRVATIMMAPVRGGKLESLDDKPALAVSGVEKVIKLEDAVVVVAKGYWQATKGIQALSPKFSDGGHAGLSTDSVFGAQAKLIDAGAKLSSPAGGKVSTANYKVPFLHQAMMEPFAMVGHYKDGKLEAWGGLQDPLSTRKQLAKVADIGVEDVTYHNLIMGGGFGRRFPDYSQIITQIAQVAKQLPYPVKLIWSREEEV